MQRQIRKSRSFHLNIILTFAAHQRGAVTSEPIANRQDDSNPEHEVLLADSVGLALLVVLDRLTPAERIAFARHDMFAVSFDEIASIVGRSPTAARQLASRARRRVQGAARVSGSDPARSRRRLPYRLARR
jgi:DNA-directed RNA polymerase specialized sigma24 family protein